MSRPYYFDVKTDLTVLQIYLVLEHIQGKQLLHNDGLSSSGRPLCFAGYQADNNEFYLKVYEIENGEPRPSTSRLLHGRIRDDGETREVVCLYGEENTSNLSWWTFGLFPVGLMSFLYNISGEGHPITWLLMLVCLALGVWLIADRKKASKVVPAEADRLAVIFRQLLNPPSGHVG